MTLSCAGACGRVASPGAGGAIFSNSGALGTRPGGQGWNESGERFRMVSWPAGGPKGSTGGRSFGHPGEDAGAVCHGRRNNGRWIAWGTVAESLWFRVTGEARAAKP